MILVKREDLKSYGFAIDWWSLGTFCYELYVGHPPFQDRNVKIMTERILNERVRFPPTVGLPSLPFRDFVFALLTRDPGTRLGTTTKVRDHVFFEGVRWEEDVFTKKQTPPVVPRFDPLEATVNFDPPSDEETAESVAKLSQMPSASSPSSSAAAAAAAAAAGGIKTAKFQRFVPLPTNVLTTTASSTALMAVVAEEEEEDELTAMFKSFAFERAAASSPASSASAPAGEDLQERHPKPVNTITEFQALWGEDAA